MRGHTHCSVPPSDRYRLMAGRSFPAALFASPSRAELLTVNRFPDIRFREKLPVDVGQLSGHRGSMPPAAWFLHDSTHCQRGAGLGGLMEPRLITRGTRVPGRTRCSGIQLAVTSLSTFKQHCYNQQRNTTQRT